MSNARRRGRRLFFARMTFASIAFVFCSTAAFVSAAAAAESIPDLAGQWGRDMLFYEPPPSGPGPVSYAVRNADGAVVAKDPCCSIVGWWMGDPANPILKPAAAAAVRAFNAEALKGTVVQDRHNACWPEPPPYAMTQQFGVLIIQREDEVTLIYLLYNTVRHVRLNVRHPDNPTLSWQGHSVGWYEGGALVIDTVGIKVTPFTTVDSFGTPHTKDLHVVERFRLIDGEAAAEAQRKNGARFLPAPPYGRSPIDQDTTRKGLQVEFTVEDPAMFTTPWSGQVTYRRLTGRWPEAVCAENPGFLGTNIVIPTASVLDF
jgi:hypothetical protein